MANLSTIITGKSSILAKALTMAIIDFGAYPGSNEASLIITGQAGISSSSRVEAYLMENDSTGDHSSNDHSYAGCFIELSCGNIIPGVGFTIYATCLDKMQGKFKTHWVWA